MAKITFLLDTYIGHIFPALGVAQSLRDNGHEVCFLGILDFKEMVEKYHFKFYSIFENCYPSGYAQVLKKMQKENSEDFQQDKIPRPHLSSIINGSLDDLIEELGPDLFISIQSLSLEVGLLKYRYPGLNFVILTTWFRNQESAPACLASEYFKMLAPEMKQSIFDFTKLSADQFLEAIPKGLKEIPEIIPCPADFDLPKAKYNKSVYHIGGALRNNRGLTDFFEQLNLPQNKKIIYASLGTQTALFLEQSRKIFRSLLNIIKKQSSQNWFLILSIGQEIDEEGLASIPGKALVVRWCPQVDVLEKASLAITHGGLGTIKECIANGVPMIVAPMVYDQHENAERVVYHGLGISIDPAKVEEAQLERLMAAFLETNYFAKNVAKMQNKFADKVQSTAQVIDALLNRKDVFSNQTLV